MKYDHNNGYELYKEKHERLVECLAELLCRKEQIKRRNEYIAKLENYCDGLESICPVAHRQTRPKFGGYDHEL